MTSLLSVKIAVKYAQLREIESMRALALTHQNRDLSSRLQTRHVVFNLYNLSPNFHCYTELSSDPTIHSHLAALHSALLQHNLQSYSAVEIDYFTSQVGQGRQDVEAKYGYIFPMRKWLMCFDTLSQMILGRVFYGVLDRGRGCLIIFDEPESDVCLPCEFQFQSFAHF